MGDRDTTNNITTCTTLILVAVTLAFAVCAEEMIDEPAADLYEQQSELYDSLLQKPATKKPATTSNRAAKIKEVDAKVAELNKQYASKKHVTCRGRRRWSTRRCMPRCRRRLKLQRPFSCNSQRRSGGQRRSGRSMPRLYS